MSVLRRRTVPPEYDWQVFDDNVAPIVQAELDRGNELLPPYGWQEVVDGNGRDRVYELHLRYTLDTEAVEAEFALPEHMRFRAGALVWAQAQYHSISGDQPWDAAREAAVRAWWQRWESSGRPRTAIEPLPSYLRDAGLPTPHGGEA